MSARGFVPLRRAPPQLARKAKDAHKDGCPYCQEKSRVSQTGDALEHEADHAADAVMRHAPPAALSASTGTLQRDAHDKSQSLPAKPGHDGYDHDGHALGPNHEGAPDRPDCVCETGLKRPLAVDSHAKYRADSEHMRAGLDRLSHPLKRPGKHPMNPKPAPTATHAAKPPAGAPLAAPPPRGATDVHASAPPPAPPRKLETTPRVQRKARGPASQVTSTTLADVLDERGASLDHAARAFMEQRFGRDFSAVRIHVGPRGARAADAFNARAFTFGEHIVFASGEYRPGTESGARLLAHELAHVAQQGAAPAHAGARDTPARARDDTAAHAKTHAKTHTKPHPQAHVPQTLRAGAPRLTRSAPAVARAAKPRSKTPKEVDIENVEAGELGTLNFKVTKDDPTDGSIKKLRTFLVDRFVVPKTKGPDAGALYNAFAGVGALKSIIMLGNDPQAGLWQKRAATTQLRNRWLANFGWSSQDADANWQDAGGDKTFPNANGKLCEMDHLVELQLGGNNTKENIQALDPDDNQSSGGTIWAELSGLAAAIKKSTMLDTNGLEQVQLVFQAATPKKSTQSKAKCKSKGNKKQPSCLAVEQCVESGKVGAGAKGREGTSLYVLSTAQGHQQTEMTVPDEFADKPTSKRIVTFTELGNNAAATLIPGLLFKTLAHGAGGNDVIEADIDTRSDTRLPLDFGAGEKGKGKKVKLNVEKKLHVVTLANAKADTRIKFYYPYLSPGEITSLTETETGLDFSGYIDSTVPLLGRLYVAYKSQDGSLGLAKKIDPETIKPPLPNTKVTEASIELGLAPVLSAKGVLAFNYAPGGKSLLDAKLTASADANGPRFKGDLNAHLPGVEATGTVEYSKTDGWKGGVTAHAADLQKKFKWVKSGDVTVGFKNASEGLAIDAQGTVTLDLPRVTNASLTLRNDQGRWMFKGKGIFDVPRMNPVNLNVEYDGEHLEAEANSVGFQYKGFDAKLKIHYLDGRFSGKGSLEFSKGRAHGKLNIELLPTEKFTGDGSVTIVVREGVEATGSVALDKDEKLHVGGKLAFVKPIHLFDAFGGQATLLKAGISIPIPGASIGPVGLKARIEGELSAGYQIGPGEIRNAAAEASFDPLEDDSNLSFKIGGQLWIGASAHITGAITGSVVFDVVVAEVSGNLTVSATASLNGEVLSNVSLTYAKSVYTLSADFAATLALAIRLALEASVRASAGIGPFKVETEKKWTLAQRSFDTGLTLGVKVKKPLTYSSDKGLDVPGPSDIEVTKPDLDPQTLLKNVFGSASANEREL
ncbi:DUF4157 domain-containing protein [Paraburkholderia sp. JHI869]|uniref:eCIS core domain-containing protein n=1 Tax=Paraburkholderia sp. JHI869 TaxID=3112959 RepID=UPI00317486DC